eukprot:sb/3479656/
MTDELPAEGEEKDLGSLNVFNNQIAGHRDEKPTDTPSITSNLRRSVIRGNKARVRAIREPTDTSKQPIRTRYLCLVTGYQQIRDEYFLIRSVPAPKQLVSNVICLCNVLIEFTSPSGFFTSGDGKLYKNISYDVRGERESAFYKSVFSEENLAGFRKFMPTCIVNEPSTADLIKLCLPRVVFCRQIRICGRRRLDGVATPSRRRPDGIRLDGVRKNLRKSRKNCLRRSIDVETGLRRYVHRFSFRYRLELRLIYRLGVVTPPKPVTWSRRRLDAVSTPFDTVYTPSQHRLIPSILRLKQFFLDFRRFFRTPSRRIPSGRRLDGVATPSGFAVFFMPANADLPSVPSVYKVSEAQFREVESEMVKLFARRNLVFSHKVGFFEVVTPPGWRASFYLPVGIFFFLVSLSFSANFSCSLLYTGHAKHS